MKKSQQIQWGIHTFSIHVPWRSYVDVQIVIDNLIENGRNIQFRHCKCNRIQRAFKSQAFWEDGIRIEGRQDHGFNNGVVLVVNPSMILDKKYDSLGLARMDKEDAQLICEAMEELLYQLNPKRPKTPCTISRIDFTCDVVCEDDDEVSTYLELFHRCNVSGNYLKWIFEIGADIETDPEKANQHSSSLLYKEGKRKSKSRPSIKLYDKAYEVAQRGFDCKHPHLLRLELSLPRKELLKKLGIKPAKSTADCWLEQNFINILHVASDQSLEILQGLLRKQFPCIGMHYTFAKAKRKIKQEVKGKKRRTEMMTLLTAVKDNGNLGVALKKLELSTKKSKSLLSNFEDIDLHPVCVPKRCKGKALQSFHGRENDLAFYSVLDWKMGQLHHKS